MNYKNKFSVLISAEESVHEEKLSGYVFPYYYMCYHAVYMQIYHGIAGAISQSHFRELTSLCERSDVGPRNSNGWLSEIGSAMPDYCTVGKFCGVKLSNFMQNELHYIPLPTIGFCRNHYFLVNAMVHAPNTHTHVNTFFTIRCIPLFPLETL